MRYYIIMNTQYDNSSNPHTSPVSKVVHSRLADLEDVVRMQTCKERTEAVILGLLSIAGIFLVGMMAPKVASMLASIIPDVQAVSQSQSIRRSIGRLIRNGYIAQEDGRYCITTTGSARLTHLEQQARVRSVGKTSQPTWDGKWRVVIFDVKEKQKTKRDALRRMLIQAGFTKLQDSVWVYPYRCDEVVALLKFHLTLGRDLVYMIVDGMEGDVWLREHYHLPPAS